MGPGTVFVYLLIAALVAPLVWVMWWGSGSLAGGRLRTVHASSPPTAGGRPREFYPTTSDLRLPIRSDAVTIYNISGAEIGTCKGPDAHGKCPRPLGDGTVPCSGCLLALPRPIRGSLEWQIPGGYRSCLLGSYEVFRQPRA